MKWSTMCCAGVVLAAGALAQAQGILYAIRESDNTLVSYDPVTLQQTVIGPMGAPGDFGDLAWDSSTGTLYYIDGRSGNSALYTVDTTTGAATLVGSHGLPEMFALEWDPSTDTMFAGQSTQAQGFYSIDRSTGAATFIGNPAINLDSLAYDSTRDMLVGAYAGPGDLYEMDRETGQATLIYDGDFFNNGGLAYDPDRDIFWFADWSGNIFQFDPNNGYARTTVLSGQPALDGLVYVPADDDECYADFDNNGALNLFDFLAFTNAFNAGAPGADCDGNGNLSLFDFLCFTNAFNEGC